MKWVSKLGATKVFAGAVALLFVASVICGMGFGWLNSPDYSDDKATLQFLAYNLRYDKTNDDDIRAHIIVGPYRYDYSQSADSVKRTVLDPISLLNMKTPKRWRYFEQKNVEEWLVMSAPAAVVAAFSRIAKETKSTKARNAEYLMIAGGTIVVGMLVSGGYLGSHLTHSDSADYNNEKFQKLLMDKDSWLPDAIQMRACKEKFVSICERWGMEDPAIVVDR